MKIKKRECKIRDDTFCYDQSEVNNLLKIKSPVLHKRKKVKVALEDAKNLEKEIHPAILYLLQWNDNKTEWKFQKVRQVWLLQNMYNKLQVNKHHFKVLLSYLNDLKGISREKTIETARCIVEKEKLLVLKLSVLLKF
uniref:Uncharacterized protein C7orf50 n=1 Tax=Hydra vulgaris TaxID=6087 RepID=T2M730_HYDVU